MNGGNVVKHVDKGPAEELNKPALCFWSLDEEKRKRKKKSLRDSFPLITSLEAQLQVSNRVFHKSRSVILSVCVETLNLDLNV